MIEIKTIIGFIDKTKEFDYKVNATIADGWDLVRRDILTGGVDHIPFLYAEMERVIEEPEEEEEEAEAVDDNTAKWQVVRNPHLPYNCSACGFKSSAPYPRCPVCNRTMLTNID